MNSTLNFIRHFFASPIRVLALSLMLGLLASALLIAVDPVFYRDSVVYLAMTKAFELGSWDAAFSPHLPPLTPVLAGIFTWTGLAAPTALLLAGCFFYVLTIFPLYGLLKNFGSEKLAAWGCLAYVLTPKIIRYGAAPLVDSGRWFATVLMLYLMFALVRKFTWSKTVALGAALALLSLARAEGLVLGLGLLGVLEIMFLQAAHWHFSFKLSGRMIGVAVLALFVAVMLLLPRVLQVYNATGYPALDSRQAAAVGGAVKVLCGTKATSTAVSALPMQKFAFDWFTDGDFNRRFWDNALLRGTYELYLGLAVLGAVILMRKRQWEFKHTLMVMLILLNIGVFYLLNAAAGRYFYIQSVLVLPFLTLALEWLFSQAERWKYAPAALGAGIFALGVGQFVNGIDNIFPSRSDFFRPVGSMLAKLRIYGDAPRSGSGAFTLLTIGTDYGWGRYAQSNTAVGRGYPFGLLQNNTLTDLARNGFPARLLHYRTEKLDTASGLELKPDFVLICDPEEHVAEISELLKLGNVDEIVTSHSAQVRIFDLRKLR